MRRLAALLALLAVAGYRTAGGSVAKTAAPIDLILGGTATVSVSPNVIETFPLDGVFIYQPDPRCSGVGTTIPSLQTAVCWRGKALEYLVREVSEKRVVPGPAFTACNWAYSEPVSWAACVEHAILSHTPEIRFGQSPVWVAGSISGEPYTGCAAGVAYPTFVRVSLADPARIYPLCAWEPANSILAYVLDRYTAADGPIVGAATDHARAACPAQ